MSTDNNSLSYTVFAERIDILKLPISSSELHGVICGYLCGGAILQGEMYLRALVAHKKKNDLIRDATVALFELFAYSQEHLASKSFTFGLLLPEDCASLRKRAQAFGEWCEGFTQGFTLSGYKTVLLDEDCQEVLHHIQEFAQLDYEGLTTGEDDEKSLMQVSEYTRIAIIQLNSDLQITKSTAH